MIISSDESLKYDLAFLAVNQNERSASYYYDGLGMKWRKEELRPRGRKPRGEIVCRKRFHQRVGRTSKTLTRVPTEIDP